MVVVSSVGAGDSRLIVGYGLGKVLALYLRHALADLNHQEAALLEAVPDRTVIVRATGLTDGIATGKLAEF